MKTVLTFLSGIIPLPILRKIFLNILGHDVSYNSKLGINILLIKKIQLKKGSKLGHFNFIKINELLLDEEAFIKSFNYLKGPFTFKLGPKSGISRQNKIRRSYSPISYGYSCLELGKNSFIVSNHLLDLTRSIKIGNDSIIAGTNSQLWTHGYYHDNKGSERIRIDGQVIIGNNVYIGSGCIFNPGVKVLDAIHIGAGSVISKNLEESGMYVSQGLRFIRNDIDNLKSRLKKVDDRNLVEEVYTKNG